MGSHLREDAMLICVTGAKWHLPCNAFQMGSYLQEDAMLSSASQVRSGICPACFPNGIVSARGCYAHLRHRSVTRCRCEVASALQCFPNGIISARTCYALLRRRALVRSGICPAVLGKWDHCCRKTLICVQHEHPIAHVDAERHLGIVLLSFGILPHERQWTQEGPVPKSREEVGAKEVDHREM